MIMSFNGLPMVWTIMMGVALLVVVAVVLFAVYALVRGHRETKEYEQSALPDSGVKDMVEEAERMKRNDLDSLNLEDLQSDEEEGNDDELPMPTDDSLPVPSPFFDDYE